MSYTISIPSVTIDDKIGNVFNHLFDVIYKIDTIKDDDVILDFSNVAFIHPFFLFPLAIFINKSEKNIKYKHRNKEILSFLKHVRFTNFLTITDDGNLHNDLECYLDKPYIPICRFERLNYSKDIMQTTLQNVISGQQKVNKKFESIISYLIGEFVCNIEQHSKSKYGYIYSQYVSQEKSIDICIADDGITILGSYVDANKFIDGMIFNDADAIKYATDGFSTKDLPTAENRGFGLSSAKKIIVNDKLSDNLSGAFFILSGGGFHRYDKKSDNIYVELPKNIYWQGTIIFMRIPTDIKEDFNIINFIE